MAASSPRRSKVGAMPEMRMAFMTRRRRTDTPLAYSKVCNQEDLVRPLEPIADRIARNPAVLHGQHPVRAWEYAMALHTIDGWQSQQPVGGGRRPGDPEAGTQEAIDAGSPLRILDVGGAGSGFWQLLIDYTSEDIEIVDPSATLSADSDRGQRQIHATTLEEYKRAVEGRMGSFDIITCISVIEHIELLPPFFRACYALLKPGGLFFGTTDYWNAEGPDVAHFHWMRKRIYNAGTMRRLLGDLREIGFYSFGASDWTYHGPAVHDYSVCSFAMLRRSRRPA